MTSTPAAPSSVQMARRALREPAVSPQIRTVRPSSCAARTIACNRCRSSAGMGSQPSQPNRRDHGPLLSRCEDGRLVPGAVTVAVTGIVDARELLAAERTRYAFADGTFDDIGSRTAPPALVPMISEPWARRFGWDGCEPIPAEERHLLHAMVRAAHEDGRTVRISGLTAGSRAARRAIWTELGAAGVDAIADHDLRGLARHLRRHPVTPQPQVRTFVSRPARTGAPAPRATVSAGAEALREVNER